MNKMPWINSTHLQTIAEAVLNSNNKHSISVQASTKNLAEVRDFVADHASKFGFNKDDVADIRLAVDEAFTNIIEHAYQNDEKESVKITLRYKGRHFDISLFDSGKSFSMVDYKEPDIKEKIKQKKRGGVGVYLIKN